ncbi:MAG TPA: ABC transporter ATP-binding protein [Hyphomicrobiaceae bacterium]|nr:ABC transporter ATP-binding protein [Hyphomicrobiaceae bacterium]
MSPQPLLEVEGLTRTFDISLPWLDRLISGEAKRYVKAVDGVSLSVRRGETLALVGESGSGKSTLARMIVGLLEPTAGRIAIDGVDMWAAADRPRRQGLRRRLQMIFQDPYASLNPRWRVGSIIADPIRAFGLAKDKAAIAARVAELLQLVGLDPASARQYPHQFSGGQRQRICIARALASNPEFVVCDEPTSALDVSVQAQILNLMRDLQDRLGISYLFISHNLAVVRYMAARVGVMYLGRIVEMAEARELFARPQHPYTRLLIDAVPDVAFGGKRRKPVAGGTLERQDAGSGCSFQPRCPRAFERCRIRAPALIEHGSHVVACHAVEAEPVSPAGGREPANPMETASEAKA